MNLQKLNNYLDGYLDFLKANPNHYPYWKWESQKIFQDNWDLDAPDFKAMFDACLDNSHSRRIWKREHYEPKTAMLHFIDLNPEFVRYMFKDLFDENKGVEGRIGRFLFHCDELLTEYREKHKASKLNTHYHDDEYQIISWYLTFRYPESYAPYHFERFKTLLEKLGSRNPPQANDTERFFKVMRTLYGFLKKRPEILEIHRSRIEERKHYTGDSLLLVEDFGEWVCGVGE
ncbi:MAG: hypothetical protein CMN32_06825 [Saprospirales bacterium]|nr:hypothetical protein [Saprospirales bacterium]